MADLLARLDQWALGVLMGIVSLFGIKDLPQDIDPNWKVEQRWEKQPDGYYLLHLNSETAQNVCKSGEAKYLIFPQTYMSKQEVFADGIRVYSNEMDKEWHLKSFLDRPVVSCDLLKVSKSIEFKVLSYEKYFASISHWPVATKSFPRGQSFYNFSYVIVGVLAMFGSITFFIIGLSFRENSFHLLVMGSGLFMVMFSHYPAYASALHVHLAHQFTSIGIAIIAYVILFEDRINSMNNKWNWIFLSIIVFEFIFSYKYPNATQLAININATVGLFLAFVSFLNTNDMSRRLMLFFSLVIGLRDFYGSQVQREGFLNLSLLCLTILCFMSYRIVLNIYNKNLSLVMGQERFENEKLMLEKMREINIRIKQILHDMKSPVTSLNFMVSSGNISENKLILPLERLNSLLDLSLRGGIGILQDWYSVKVLENSISIVAEEKKYVVKNINFIPIQIETFLIFIDPEVVKLVIAELISNSLKNNSSDVKIDISIGQNANRSVLVKYKDDGVGISKENLKNIGSQGYSSGGTGLGLFSVFERLKDMRAELILESNEQGGFCADITFLTKST